MDLEKQPAPRTPGPEGCLTVAIRIPVRIVVLVLVVPVRVVWDALVVTGRFLRDSVLRPLWRALVVWPCVALWRYGVVPLAKALGWLGKVLLVIPLVWLYRYVLTPLGHGIAWVARGIGAGLEWLYARVLTPVGHGVLWLARGVGAVLAWIFTPLWHALAWCGRGIAWLANTIAGGVGVALYWIARILLVLPALALWRWVLTPVGRVLAVVGREVWDALGHAWRIAGHISLAVGRFLGTLFRWVFVEPVRWAYRTVLTPVGHVVRDVVLRPAAEAARSVGRITRATLASARESVREARADFRRMLFGEPREREAVLRREPTAADTRTLGSSTTALTKD
ncbi:hypothetical protein [Streptomyces sp. SID13726]|uniref:hypothetical protein n=1 Tax=Streptomyces sp. SID13726 TaxID=2706058 RepID=UPI0013BBF73B|nr:hypothetical protein [Streptomyces sp. SID13726]NEB06340.1 hypothetical protein [Streptomyces sp. SID13726]